jgi:hypothetical protein
MEFNIDRNIAVLGRMIEYFGSAVPQPSDIRRRLKYETDVADTVIKLINCQTDLLSKSEEASNVLYQAYIVFKFLQGKEGKPVTWKHLIQSRIVKGGVKLYRPAMQFLVDTGMVDEELAELGMDNSYTLTGKQFTIDVGGGNQLPDSGSV